MMLRSMTLGEYEKHLEYYLVLRDYYKKNKNRKALKGINQTINGIINNTIIIDGEYIRV